MRVLAVGDFIVDRYWLETADRVTDHGQETPSGPESQSRAATAKSLRFVA